MLNVRLSRSIKEYFDKQNISWKIPLSRPPFISNKTGSGGMRSVNKEDF